MPDPLIRFREVIEAAGLRPARIIADGNLHRCPTESKPKKQNGWYILHFDAPASGAYGDWASGLNEKWTAKKERSMTRAERQALKARIEAVSLARREDEAMRHCETAAKAQQIFIEAPACESHPYFDCKGVTPCPGLKLAHDGRLIVPVLDEQGKPMSLQFIDGTGGKRFLTGGRTRGGYFVIQGSVGPLYIAEGLATGLSIHEATGHTVLCAFNAGNLESVAAHARKAYPDRELVLCADNDHATDGNPGLTKATTAAHAVEALLAMPIFKDPKARTDFNDLHQAEGLDVVREQLTAAAKLCTAPVAISGKSASAQGGQFSLQADGVYFLEEEKDGGMNPVWVCSPLRIMARTRNGDGQEWGYLLEVLDSETQVHLWAMPARLMAGNGDGYRSELLGMGLRIAPGLKGKQRLDLYLSTARVEGYARCVDRIGWHGGAFVLPDVVYGDQAGELIVPQGIPSENHFRQKGTLEEWQKHVGRLCVGNSRLIMAVSAALAPVLLEPMGAESGGIHLVGGSSLGKTTALRLAGSVCGGGPSGFIRQWRATDNGLEGIAAAHCDALLCLDEMGQAGAKVVSEAAYMLANGQGKSRASRDGQTRKAQTWRVLYLSSGEVTLADKVAEDGKGRAKAGQTVRVVDVPADAGTGLGLFEELHGCESAEQFARQLKDASTSYYGTANRAFLQAFVANRELLVQQAKEIMKTFVANNCARVGDGQVQRVCGRFALVAAAGELGIALKVLPWESGEAFKAVTKCYNAWIEQRGGTGAAEVRDALDRLRHFIEANGSSRFRWWEDEKEKICNRAGFRRKIDADAVDYYFLPSVFNAEICAGHNRKQVVSALIEIGVLVPGSGGKYSASYTVTGEGKMRLYRLRTAALFA